MSSMSASQPASANSGSQASEIQLTSIGALPTRRVTSAVRNCAQGKFS